MHKIDTALLTAIVLYSVLLLLFYIIDIGAFYKCFSDDESKMGRSLMTKREL